MSYERTQAALLNLHGVTISQGGIDQVLQRASKAADAQMPALLEAVQASAVINSDETSVRQWPDLVALGRLYHRGHRACHPHDTRLCRDRRGAGGDIAG
jgi:hypothetical protein